MGESVRRKGCAACEEEKGCFVVFVGHHERDEGGG